MADTPIATIQRFMRENNLRQIIIVGWDGEYTKVTTYGITDADKSQAAMGGRLIAKTLGLKEREPDAKT